MTIESIKKNTDFAKAYKKGVSKVHAFLVLYRCSNGLPHYRIGISVSKKVGNSVVRSRVKRLIKEVCRLNTQGFKPGYDYVFVARVRMKDATYNDTFKSFSRLMDQLEGKQK